MEQALWIRWTKKRGILHIRCRYSFFVLVTLPSRSIGVLPPSIQLLQSPRAAPSTIAALCVPVRVIVLVLLLFRRLNGLLEGHADLLRFLTWEEEKHRLELAVDRGSGGFTIYPHVDLVWVEA